MVRLELALGLGLHLRLTLRLLVVRSPYFLNYLALEVYSLQVSCCVLSVVPVQMVRVPVSLVCPCSSGPNSWLISLVNWCYPSRLLRELLLGTLATLNEFTRVLSR